MHNRGLLGAAVIVAATSITSVAAGQQSNDVATTVWDGVYTNAQATRGRRAYNDHCESCHPAASSGTARSLIGPRFWNDWGEDTLDSLFSVTRRTMPRNQPGMLQDATYLDIVAYILQANALPAGTSELTSQDVRSVRVIPKGGSAGVPNFSLVSVVGCLTIRRPKEWRLIDATDPIRTRNPNPSNDVPADDAGAGSGRGRSYELLDVYIGTPPPIDHRVEAKGFLIRGTPDRLTVTSLRSVADSCQSP